MQRLTYAQTEQLAADIEVLYGKLSTTSPPDTTVGALRRMADNYPHSQAILAFDGNQVVGMASLVQKVHLNWIGGSLEDIVVFEAYRNRGIAKTLVQRLIHIARIDEIEWLDLTSAPHRTAAHHVYEGLGFKRNETYVYELQL